MMIESEQRIEAMTALQHIFFYPWFMHTFRFQEFSLLVLFHILTSSFCVQEFAKFFTLVEFLNGNEIITQVCFIVLLYLLC